MQRSSSIFNRYVDHVLKWEGRTSKDPNDSAATCAPFYGAYHTNKGVTFCTFRNQAAAVGIYPVTYERFLQLTRDDVSRFMYAFYQAVQGPQLPDNIALAVTEAAWGSGPYRAGIHLQDALNAMGYNLTRDGDIGPLTIAAARSANQSRLFQLYTQYRAEFLRYLASSPDYDQYLNGWLNRLGDFTGKFATGSSTNSRSGGREQSI